MDNAAATQESQPQQPPHSAEAEEATLGSILINPDAMLEVAPLLKVEDFYIVRNGWVFEALLALNARSEQIDYLTVIEELKTQGRLDEVGGAAYITYLINHTPSTIYTETYAKVVERASYRRRVLSYASEIAKDAHDETSDMSELRASIETGMLELTSTRREGALISASEAAQHTLSVLEATHKTGGNGIKSGFHDLDALLGGFFPDDLYTVAGRPGMGKTSFLLTIARLFGRGALFSIEMPREQVVLRLSSMEQLKDDGGKSLKVATIHDARTGAMTDDVFKNTYSAIGNVGMSEWLLDDTAGIMMPELWAKVMRAHQQKPLKWIMIDYIQLMNGDQSRKFKDQKRHQEVGHNTRMAKQLARALHIPVIIAAQLNRNVEGRKDKRPTLSDLKESGDIEQDSDVVMFLYRDEYYNDNTERPNQCDVIIAKHRNGPTGVVPLFFRKELTQFANLTKTKHVDLTPYDAHPTHSVRTERSAAGYPGVGVAG